VIARTAGINPAARPRRWLLPMLLVAGLAVLAWAGGLVWFVHRIGLPVPAPPVTDGIVALTGGAGRVEAALRLLADQPNARLLITGIGGGTDLETLAARAGIDPRPLARRVTLGREAISTRGNAIETRAWSRANDIRTLTVVTAPFHLPRALAELHRALPNVALFPLAVLGPEPGGARRQVSLRVLIGEYSKYLVAVAGLSGLAPGRDPPRSGPAAG
jgi:uncharacterized SAM-binding protein YcdF (DUF218 family)